MYSFHRLFEMKQNFTKIQPIHFHFKSLATFGIYVDWNSFYISLFVSVPVFSYAWIVLRLNCREEKKRNRSQGLAIQKWKYIPCTAHARSKLNICTFRTNFKIEHLDFPILPDFVYFIVLQRSHRSNSRFLPFSTHSICY